MQVTVLESTNLFCWLPAPGGLVTHVHGDVTVPTVAVGTALRLLLLSTSTAEGFQHHR